MFLFYLTAKNRVTKQIFYSTDSEGKTVEHSTAYKDVDLTEMVEGALKQADKDNDGFITYAEFRSVTV